MFVGIGEYKTVKLLVNVLIISLSLFFLSSSFENKLHPLNSEDIVKAGANNVDDNAKILKTFLLFFMFYSP